MIVDSGSTLNTTPYTEPASIWPTALKWGGIAGVASCVITLLTYNLGFMEIGDDGQPPSTWLQLIASIVLYAGLLYLGMKAYRDVDNHGELTFGRAVVWSLGFGAVLGLVSAVFALLFYNVLAPDLLNDMLEGQMVMIEEQGGSEEQIEMTESVMGTMFNPWVMSLTGLISAIITSLIVGMLVALTLKTPPRY